MEWDIRHLCKLVSILILCIPPPVSSGGRTGKDGFLYSDLSNTQITIKENISKV